MKRRGSQARGNDRDDAPALDSIAPELLAGLLVADGRPIELHLELADATAAAGDDRDMI